MFIRKQEITVTEKALEPVIPAGATVICSDGVTPEQGDFIVYFPQSGIPIFRKWRVLSGETILLEALNKEADSYRASMADLTARGTIFVILSMKRTFRTIVEEKLASDPVEMFSASSEDFLTFQEAMSILKVKRTRMYALLQTGALRASKLGRLWRIERNSLNEFIRNCRKKK